MAQPTPYNRLYDFSDYQEVNPTKPLRGSEVDAEFDAIKLTTDQIRANAAQIQRDDGSLANQSVTPDSLSAGTLAMIHQGEYVPRGAWAAITAYAMGDLVTYNAATYLCIAAHTAQAAFPDDLAANRWVLIANGALSGQASAIDLFEGNAATTTYTLSYTYANSNAAVVFVGGVALIPVQDFTISGTTLTFVVAPPAPSVAGRKNVMVRGTGIEAQLAANAAAAAATDAQGFASAASGSAAAALTSKNAAAASQSAAATSATNAASSATSASNSAATATTQAASATSSATSASGSASTAITQASNAATSANNAASSASNAESWATSTSPFGGSGGLKGARGYANDAAASATSASTSATNASTSATNASSSATGAAGSATTASTQATNASNSATAAATSATNAANSATAAANSATATASSATSASNSASTATTQASNAATSATNAANSASTATTQASNAATSASNAAGSATAAAGSATAAAGSASNAATSETNAAASAAAAAAALDNFDDRYLGAKSAAPTVDNDGNPLVAGALYFNNGTVILDDKGMWVYDGGTWIKASSAQQAALVTYEFVATAGQTTFSGNDANGLALTYIAGGVIVALNGVVLRPGDDYTATNGSSIVLASAAALNDELQAFAFASFNIANTYTQAQADALLATKVNKAGDTITGDLILAKAAASNPVRSLFITNTAATGNLGQGAQISFGNDVGSSAASPSGFIRTINRNAASQASAMILGGFNGSGAQDHMLIEPGGQIRAPFQPAFFVRFSSTNSLLGSGVQVFNDVLVNIGNNYSTGNGRFTAPVAGRYLISANAQHYGGSASAGYCDILLNGGLVRGLRMESNDINSYASRSAAGVLNLNAGDYVEFVCNAANIFWSDHTSFSGHLIG